MNEPNVTSYCRDCGKLMGKYSDLTGVPKEIRERICYDCMWVGVFNFSALPSKA